MLGELSGDTARLGDAVAAYRQALAVYRRKDSPQDWARTQGNLGNALRALGELSSDTARLVEAVAACQQALEVFSREDMPRDWARTQNNRGNALLMQGQLTGDAARLAEAVEAYRHALAVRDAERTPVDYLGTMWTLSRALVRQQAWAEAAAATESLLGAGTALVLAEPTRSGSAPCWNGCTVWVIILQRHTSRWAIRPPR